MRPVALKVRKKSLPCPDGLGRHGQGELSGTAVLPQTALGQICIAPWTDRPPPGKKEKLSNKQ
jgi:hypothetical protein